VRLIWTFFAVLNAIATPSTIALNFLIIWTILRDKELKKANHNIQIVALAATDFAEGLIVDHIFSWYLFALPKRRPIRCHFLFYAVPGIVLGCWTVNTLAALSVDMYLSVDYPLSLPGQCDPQENCHWNRHFLGC